MTNSRYIVVANCVTTLQQQLLLKNQSLLVWQKALTLEKGFLQFYDARSVYHLKVDSLSSQSLHHNSERSVILMVKLLMVKILMVKILIVGRFQNTTDPLVVSIPII